MRTFSIAVILLSLVSCVWAADQTVTIMAGKAPVLELAAPREAKVTPFANKTVIQTTNIFLHVWPVADARTVDEAQSRLGDVIKGDVLKFSASATNEITIAGSPARHLMGNGVEADDGDNGTADVVIFSVGTRIFVACVHGEGNDASQERAPMLKILQTAKPPHAQPAGK